MLLNIESFIISINELEYVFNYLDKYYLKKNDDGNRRGSEMFSKLKEGKYEYFIKVDNYLILNILELENLQKYILEIYKCDDEKLAVSSKEYMYYHTFMKNIMQGLEYLKKLR